MYTCIRTHTCTSLCVCCATGALRHTQTICTAILCLAVLIGLSGELWNLMPKTNMHVLLPVVVGGAVLIGNLIMIPIGEPWNA